MTINLKETQVTLAEENYNSQQAGTLCYFFFFYK